MIAIIGAGVIGLAHEQGGGLPGLINLIGIESPGITSSPAMAKHVGDIVDGIL